ncbi:hypothetical protein Tco_0950674, partial [Tanacetum coccineum]
GERHDGFKENVETPSVWSARLAELAAEEIRIDQLKSTEGKHVTKSYFAQDFSEPEKKRFFAQLAHSAGPTCISYLAKEASDRLEFLPSWDSMDQDMLLLYGQYQSTLVDHMDVEKGIKARLTASSPGMKKQQGLLMHTKSLSEVLSEVVLVLRVKPTAQRLRSNMSHKDNYRKIPGFYSNKSSGTPQSPPFK